MSKFTQKLSEACLAEHARFTKSNGKQGSETDDPYVGFVGEYWKSINLNLDGLSVDDNGDRIPWSAAFVSFVVRKAGAGDKFLYADAHHHYIRQALLAAEDGVAGTAYVAKKFEGYVPVVGDIVAKGRGSAKNFTWDKALAKARKNKDRNYISHCDVVVEVGDKFIRTIGGNVENSVTIKTWKTNKAGNLLPYVEKNSAGVATEYPWIAVLSCRI